MSSLLTGPQPTSLVGIAPADVPERCAQRGINAISDAQLTDLVAELLARPKVAQADSFVLHAPLELLARAALLPLVEPHARDLARQRMVWLGAVYSAAGDEVARAPGRSFADPEAAVRYLVDALSAGDLDAVDDAAAWLAGAVTPVELSRMLAEPFLPRLSAAGHGSIMLWLLPRVAPRSAQAAGMVRGMVRELARQPEWNVTWHRHRHRQRQRPPVASTSDPSAGAHELVERLLRPPSPGDPGSNFIFPTMSIVDSSGLASELLDRPTQSMDVHAATHALMRVAAWSMLQDDAEQAPYGWTHCLTMPQAALGVHGVAGIPESGAEPEDAIAVAATYVLGFRATQGRVTLDPRWVPEPPALSHPLDSLAQSPHEEASGAWHAAEHQVPAIVARLVSRAAVHPDAHLAKYTLACLDASNADPAAGRLYLAAAAHLGAWWDEHPVTDDPLLG